MKFTVYCKTCGREKFPDKEYGPVCYYCDKRYNQ